MNTQFNINIDAWENGAAIPAKFAFGKPGIDSPFAPGENINPAIGWSNAPEGTKSFAIICHDPDVPSSGEDVNQEGKTVPSSLPRVDFYHWVLVNIPADVSGLDEGASSKGITPRGKAVGQTPNGMAGKNDYTGWFIGDADMEGVYGGYDGPCPPWNDSIVHHYHFEVFALDIDTLNLEGEFTGQDVREEIKGHVLASASHMGTYSMNPAIKA